MLVHVQTEFVLKKHMNSKFKGIKTVSFCYGANEDTTLRHRDKEEAKPVRPR